MLTNTTDFAQKRFSIPSFAVWFTNKKEPKARNHNQTHPSSPSLNQTRTPDSHANFVKPSLHIPFILVISINIYIIYFSFLHKQPNIPTPSRYFSFSFLDLAYLCKVFVFYTAKQNWFLFSNRKVVGFLNYPSVMNSQAVVLATAMVVSSTVLFLAFGKQKASFSSSPENQDNSQDPPGETLRSCLYSEEKKRQRKKKRVHFAENVKDTSGNGEEYRKEQSKKFIKKYDRICRNEIRGMPANRVALYNGILRDRVHRTECSY